MALVQSKAAPPTSVRGTKYSGPVLSRRFAGQVSKTAITQQPELHPHEHPVN